MPYKWPRFGLVYENPPLSPWATNIYFAAFDKLRQRMRAAVILRVPRLHFNYRISGRFQTCPYLFPARASSSSRVISASEFNFRSAWVRSRRAVSGLGTATAKIPARWAAVTPLGESSSTMA